jgi:endonuclease/exonuclease/phosphatase family metal-dependent hydrolase
MTGAPSGRYPRIARELERLDPDIILLQEAWSAKARQSAPRNRGWNIARAAGQHSFFQQSGLVTLSKFPILGGKFYPFSRATFPDRFVNKGVLKITILLPDGIVLNVWNVHLQDGGPPEIRACQIRELVSHMQAAEDGQIADLVAGDFNCTPGSVLYRELETTLGSSLQHIGRTEPFITWDALSAKPNAGQTLDYVFVRNRTRLESVQAAQHVAFTAADRKQRLSDHFGIEAVVNFTPTLDVAGAIGSRFGDIPVQNVSDRRTVVAGGE